MSRIAIILSLPAEYNTSSMLRCRAIIQSLISLGHTVKCYMPNPDKESKYYSTAETINGCEVFRYGRVIKSGSYAEEALSAQRKSIKSVLKVIAYRVFKKLDVFGATLLYLPEKKKICEDIKKDAFDILISFSDPMTAHMIGKYCKRHNRSIRYIQQWGDPLASDTISKTAQPVWFRKIVEQSLLKPADRVCYVSPFTKEEQQRIFKGQASKMIFLPTPSLEYEDEKTRTSGRLCLGYFGSYNSVARNLVPFYQAALEVKEADFLIIGDSDLDLSPADNIRIIQRVSHDELSRYMGEIDVIVCLMNIKGNQIPGKVYHDASSVKDILFLKDGEYGDDIERFFSKYDHYTFVNNKKEDIIMAVNSYLKNGVPVRVPVSDFRAENIARTLISEK